MTKSAKGDADNFGKMVKQKSGLNRVILEQGWGMFKTFLEYRQLWSGGQVLYVDPKHTSQECPKCHHKSKNNRLTQSEFECVECHHKEHADVVGAKNVLERGHRLLACGRVHGCTKVEQRRSSCRENWVTKLCETGTRQLSDELEPVVA